MSTFIEMAPLINMGVIVGGGLLFIVRINDVLKRVMESSEKLSNTVAGIDKRVTVVEAVCALNHTSLRSHQNQYVAERENE